ncbi:MAG: aminotransferase class I/II-fold pyridoxal phosphate-dependent enzyme [Rhodospirillales bacterium]|nr:aminotransferase class I/II-fold pyridoxal phosphate-dependent enzyme [Rhodospirillales bacterium]
MLNPRLNDLIDYPFDRLRALLDGHASQANVEPLAFSIGAPRHAPPAMVAEILAAESAGWGQYPPIDGTPEFIDAVSGWLSRRFNLPPGFVNGAAHVLAASGTREVLFMAGMLCVPETKNGKSPAVLIPNPFYQVYSGSALMNGAEAVFLPTGRETNFLPDLDSLTNDVLDRTVVFFLCTPSNPQGAVADLAYLKKAVELARAHDFLLAVDECYTEIYDRDPPPGALQACAELGGGFENVLVFHSLSKRSSVPGLRSGFVAGDPNLIAPLRRLRTFSAATVPRPVMAASAALWRDDEHVHVYRELYRANFQAADEILDGRYGYYRPPAGFFLWLDVGDGVEAALTLWRKAGLRVLPGEYLARQVDGVNPGRPFIRVALVHDLETTREGLARLRTVLG